MSYKNLKNFQVIFNRDDFNYISEHKKIKEIEEIILYHISNPDGRESIYIKLLEEFVTNLNSFFLYRLNEHAAYKAQLSSSPEKVLFSAL